MLLNTWIVFLLMAQGGVDFQAAYQGRRAQFAQEIQAHPCDITSARIDAMSKELLSLSNASGLGDQRDGVFLRQMQSNSCQTSHSSSSLPPFESALWAMADARRLDPCTYNKATNYSKIINDPMYQTFQSKPYYDNGGKRTFEIYFDRVNEERKSVSST